DQDNRLELVIEAETDRPTIANLTGHSYFNLAGEGSAASALDHRLYIVADHYTPVGPDVIPTGVLAPVDGTPFDFREASPIGIRINDARDEQIGLAGGYDHNFVLRDAVSPE